MAEISKATIADIGELNKLINSAYRGETAKKGWTNEAHLLGGIRVDEEELGNIINREKSFFLKYTENQKITACVLLEKHDDEMYLGMLTVSPELQGRGVGKELLKAVEIQARQSGCAKIYMTVISVRIELIAWYQRHGYKDTGIRKPFPVDQKFRISKNPLEFIVLEKEV